MRKVTTVQMIAVNQEQPDEKVVHIASRVLSRGGVVVFPTDSVYGIGCCARDENPGYARIFSIKKRPATQSLPWLIADIEDLRRYGKNISCETMRLASQLWPGALTLVVDASDLVPQMYREKDNTVALRIPDSNLVRQIIREVQCPLATTSANTHGKPSPISAVNLENSIVCQSDLTLDGGSTVYAQSSTIVRCEKNSYTILRQGAIPASRVEELINGEDGRGN